MWQSKKFHGFPRIRRLMAAYATARSANESSAAAAILDELLEASEAFARRKAEDVAELLCKIGLWRLVAPEDALSPDRATADEALARSIMDDCERLLGLPQV